jgi:hypothetical protein
VANEVDESQDVKASEGPELNLTVIAERLINACKGKTFNQGGYNTLELLKLIKSPPVGGPLKVPKPALRANLLEVLCGNLLPILQKESNPVQPPVQVQAQPPVQVQAQPPVQVQAQPPVQVQAQPPVQVQPPAAIKKVRKPKRVAAPEPVELDVDDQTANEEPKKDFNEVILRLKKACKGKSFSEGGYNMQDLIDLIKNPPIGDQLNIPEKMSRANILEVLCGTLIPRIENNI